MLNGTDDLFALKIDAPINPDGEGCEQYLTWPEIWTGGFTMAMPKTNDFVPRTILIEAATFTSEEDADKALEDYEYRAAYNNREPLPCVIVPV